MRATHRATQPQPKTYSLALQKHTRIYDDERYTYSLSLSVSRAICSLEDERLQCTSVFGVIHKEAAHTLSASQRMCRTEGVHAEAGGFA